MMNLPTGFTSLFMIELYHHQSKKTGCFNFFLRSTIFKLSTFNCRTVLTLLRHQQHMKTSQCGMNSQLQPIHTIPLM